MLLVTGSPASTVVAIFIGCATEITDIETIHEEAAGVIIIVQVMDVSAQGLTSPAMADMCYYC